MWHRKSNFKVIFKNFEINIERYEEHGIPIKATSFEFSDLDRNFNSKNYYLSNKIKFSKNLEKPIFLVSK